MIHYLRRRKASRITPELVLNALERNFNGCEDFLTVCKNFLGPVSLKDILLNPVPTILIFCGILCVLPRAL